MEQGVAANGKLSWAILKTALCRVGKVLCKNVVIKIRWSYLPLAATVGGISFIAEHRERVEADAGGI